MRGADIDNIVKKMDKKCPKYVEFDVIYTLVGINNLTHKGHYGMVEPVFDNVPELIETLCDKFTALKVDLMKRSKFLVIGQIVGINIDQYNHYRDEGRCFFQQDTINQAFGKYD